MNIASCVTVGGLLLLAFAARAAEPGDDQRAQAAGAAPIPLPGATGAPIAGAQGMRVYIDPATGALTDGPVTPEQRAQDKALALPAPDYSKVTYETKSDGTVVAHANGQFENTSTVSIDADGNTRIGCTQTGSHAGHAHGTAPERKP